MDKHQVELCRLKFACSQVRDITPWRQVGYFYFERETHLNHEWIPLLFSSQACAISLAVTLMTVSCETAEFGIDLKERKWYDDTKLIFFN